MAITFRPITDADREFLFRVYASTREDELALTNWSATEKQAFLNFQFEAQHTYYMQHFSGAAFLVIEDAGIPIGRLYLDRRQDELRLIDIALLPACRGKGIGSHIMRGILAEARQTALPVRIHVEKNNPAMHLYQRLQFHKLEDQGVYDLMEWRPE